MKVELTWHQQRDSWTEGPLSDTGNTLVETLHLERPLDSNLKIKNKYFTENVYQTKTNEQTNKHVKKKPTHSGGGGLGRSM